MYFSSTVGGYSALPAFLLNKCASQILAKKLKEKQFWPSFSGIQVYFNLVIPPSDSPWPSKNHTRFYWIGTSLHYERFMFGCLPCWRSHSRSFMYALRTYIWHLRVFCDRDLSEHPEEGSNAETSLVLYRHLASFHRRPKLTFRESEELIFYLFI